MLEKNLEIKVSFTITAESELRVEEDMATIKCAIDKVLNNRFHDHPSIRYDGLGEMLVRQDLED